MAGLPKPAPLAPSTVAARTDAPSKSLHGVPGVVTSSSLTVSVSASRRPFVSGFVLDVDRA
jgi:hypothetical protein